MANYDFINKGMQYRLHSVLKISDFWPQFIESIANEVSLIKEEDDKIAYFNNIYEQLEDGNLDIAEKFGYTPNLVLNNSLDYVRRQSESIPFRISKKTTYLGYDLNFKMIERLGDVYNLFWSGSKLIRAIRWGSTFSNLDAMTNLTLPFTGVVADRNFSSINLGGLELMDDDNYLDESPPLLMDTGSITYPTKHLTIELIADQLVSRDLEEYIFYDSYFKYLEQGTEYNRQAPVVPHNGGQLNIITTSSGGYDFFNIGGDYSTPLLKMKSSITYHYIVRENIVGLMQLDSAGRTLDEPIIWTMDGSDELPIPVSTNDFKYISVGGGSHFIPSTEQARVLNDSSAMVVYYTFDDDDSSNDIIDLSNNNNDAIIYGNQKKVQGIIGKTVDFDGATHVQSSLILIQGNYNFGLWTRLDNTKSEHTIFDLSFIKLSYSFLTGLLTLNFATLNFTYAIDLSTEHFIEIEIDDTNKDLRLFIDSNLVYTLETEGETFGGEYDLYIGSNSSLTTYSQGIIDDFFIFIKNFSQSEKEYIYANKMGVITKLDRFYNRTTLVEAEKNEASLGTWLSAQSYNKANYVNDEFAFLFSTGIDTYVGTTFFPNLIPLRTAISYSRIEGTEIVNEKVYDNGVGKFEGEYISGTIDYSTGEYLINAYSINRELYDVLSSTPTDTISNAISPNVELGSFQVIYSIGGTMYVGQDDTAGNIVGTGITSGTIDYVTGIIAINFSSITDGEVSCRFLYKKIPNFTDGSIATVEYFVQDKLEVTEVAIEDENKNVLVYATFPPIEFNTLENHLATTFFIRKI